MDELEFQKPCRFLDGLPNLSTLGSITTRPYFCKAMTDKNNSTPGIRVLVVDDVSANLRIAGCLLHHLGCEVSTAEDAMAGIEILKSTPIDIVFSDMEMPGLDGGEAVHLYHEAATSADQDGTHKLVVFAVTGQALGDEEKPYLEAGFDGYIPKPLTTKSFVSCLEQWRKNQEPPPSGSNPIEITKDIQLSDQQQALMQLHTFLNIMNILIGEMQLIRLDLGQPSSLGKSYRIAETVLKAIKEGDLNNELALELSSLNLCFSREVEEALAAASKSDPSIDESVDNVRNILNVLGVRLQEYFERQRTGLDWKLHSVEKLEDNFMKFFAAVEKNSRGRYHIIFNLAAQDSNDYLVNLKIEGLNGSDGILMPPVIQDVFRDLIANARKYTPPGGEISAGLLQLEDELRLVVEDNGCGIAQEEIEKVVEFGYRAKATLSKATTGGGFGLTKAYVMTRQLGGRMWIESEVGNGTRVNIRIPTPRDV